jgi:rubrerythrin
MPDPTAGSNAQILNDIVSESAASVMHCLAAAERAVLDGRFNIAKVLRACAHSSRLTAMTAARLLAQDTRPVTVLASTLALLKGQSLDRDSLRTLASEHRDQHPTRILANSAPSEALEDLVQRALMSLEDNRDVLESIVAQSLWGCQVCGAITEGPAPAGCPNCGALAFEFEWFGPFYGASPAEISRILLESPTTLASLHEGLDETYLSHRPSADEWSMKEIAGHLIDVTEVFMFRLRTIQDAGTPPSLDGQVAPWRLLEGKGYRDVPSMHIIDTFRTSTRKALDAIAGIGAENWGRHGFMRGRMTTILDLGTWLANHNIAHLAQIQALRDTPLPR